MTNLDSISRRYAAIFHSPVTDPDHVAPDGISPRLQCVLLGAALLARCVATACCVPVSERPTPFQMAGVGFVASIDADDVLQVRFAITGVLVAKSVAGVHHMAQPLPEVSLKEWAVSAASQAQASVGSSLNFA